MRSTIVVPCFNEADRLDVDAFASFDLAGAGFLFVDDGSTDGTGAVLERLVARDPGRLAMVTLERNSGKAEAVRRGVLRAVEQPGVDLVGYFDADLSTPLGELARLIEILSSRSDLEGLLGARVRMLGSTIDRRVVRHVSGRLFAAAVTAMLRLPVYDTQCGAKVFRASPIVVQAFEEPFLSRWAFDVELITRICHLALAAGRDPLAILAEQPLEEWRDVAGSKLRLRHGLKALFDLVRIRRRHGPVPRATPRRPVP